MTRRERSLIEDAYCALEDGDVNIAGELLRIGLDEERPALRPVCPVCKQHAWPGEPERHLFSAHNPVRRAA